MRRSRKVTFVAISLAVAAFTSMIVSGCTQTVEQQEPDATIPTKPQGEMPEMPMTKVAEILGIEQQELEDAMAQVLSEMPGDASGPRPSDGVPDPRGLEDGPPPS
jgi:hypothetical protein